MLPLRPQPLTRMTAGVAGGGAGEAMAHRVGPRPSAILGSMEEHAPGDEPGRLPDFVVVGAMRSGSTSLYRVLSEHADVHMAPGKELHFFDRHHERGLDWYRSSSPRARRWGRWSAKRRPTTSSPRAPSIGFGGSPWRPGDRHPAGAGGAGLLALHDGGGARAGNADLA